MTRFLTTAFFLLITLEGVCQLRCVDVVARLEPDPYELLNDSISHIATAEQIQDLIDEQNLLFSYNFNLRTLEINRLNMDYFGTGIFDEENPLTPELINKLEHFFQRNLKVVIKPEHLDFKQDQTIDCAFSSRIMTE